MKAAVYHQFNHPLTLETVSDPTPPKGGAVIKVEATGLCLSDWHGWAGHDPDIVLPHVPGHEFAGIIQAIGKNVNKWRVGDRVAIPFVCACGICLQCHTGQQQICDNQSQPGFTHWGSFAEYTTIEQADMNLVALPESIDYATAASLGCRFATAFRAVVAQGQVNAGQWVAIHGCGGVGLSAIMIAQALGAQVIAIDIADEKLSFAKTIGATATINAELNNQVVEQVIDITKGGAHVSIDALGSAQTCFNSVANLRKHGKHKQVGLMVAADSHASIPMDKIIANELQIMGSHGMQAHKYPELLNMIESGQLKPQQLISQTISLEQSLNALPAMHDFNGTGITVIDRF